VQQIQSDTVPLSLYVHIPWCVRKCPYCDFNSHTSDTALPETQYVTALLQDLEEQLSLVQGRKIHSVFFGGGTPSLFSAQSIEKIIDGIDKRIGFKPEAEITLEANPGTVEQQRFNGYFSAGVNRLSIGVQSFQSAHLKSLGRIHSGDEAIRAISAAQQAGFNNFNIDLMHGLPEQTADNALNDLQQAIDLGCTHLSWYQLTIEPNTAFYSSKPVLPADDTLSEIQDEGEELLGNNGFKQYEISAFSKPDKKSVHNMNYWLFGDYIGIGAGAHGKLTQAESNKIIRRWNTRIPADYLNSDKRFCAGEKTLSQEELPLEFMMNALRLRSGFAQETFTRTTGLDYSVITHTVDQLCHQGLLSNRNKIVTTTDLGRRFLNEVLAKF